MSYDDVKTLPDGETGEIPRRWPKRKRFNLVQTDEKKSKIEAELRIRLEARAAYGKSQATREARASKGARRKVRIYGGELLREIGALTDDDKKTAHDKGEDLLRETTKFDRRGRQADIQITGPSFRERLDRCQNRQEIETLRTIAKGQLSRQSFRKLDEAVMFARVRCSATMDELRKEIGDALTFEFTTERASAYRSYAEKRAGQIQTSNVDRIVVE